MNSNDMKTHEMRALEDFAEREETDTLKIKMPVV
jgi:hypothetical protein